MNTIINDILVFKTNLASEEALDSIRPILDDHPQIMRWNVDHWDIDKVLRVVTNSLAPHTVIEMVRQAGFVCEELPD
ncbi:MAG: hypothetical protein WKF70_09555 [Chitinophagaceae bacterium]